MNIEIGDLWLVDIILDINEWNINCSINCFIVNVGAVLSVRGQSHIASSHA